MMRALILAGALAAVGCIKPPEIVMVRGFSNFGVSFV